MRIAFVGKGGSGKSTTTALYLLHRIKEQSNGVCYDADLNIHIPNLLGITDTPPPLSHPQYNEEITTHLKGSSAHIKDASHFYKTTPPSRGVNTITLKEEDPIIKKFTTPYKTSRIGIVGTYEKEEIGTSCYHTNLSILENILSFTKLIDDEWLVVDMVAGIDAFANTLHKQFDILCLVVEPTQESVAVFNQYAELAEHAGVKDRLFVIGNKIEDEEDEAFLKEHIPAEKFLGALYKNAEIKKRRQKNLAFDQDILTHVDEGVFENITNKARSLKKSPNERLRELHELHRKYIQQDYVKNAVGDLSHQIDEAFHF